MMRALLICAAAVIIIGVAFVASVVIWRRRNRDFRAAVVIETLRLWRNIIQEYRDAHPFEEYSVDVATEAAYNATKPGNAQKIVATRAWDNVKQMTKYRVQGCEEGKNVGASEIVYANTDLEAAQSVAFGVELRRKGKLGELRARVWTTVDPVTETAFHADVPHVIR
jgi:hypothetical protein